MQTHAKNKPRISLGLRDFLQKPPTDWLIDGVLQSSGLTVLYGEPGSGKTFLGLDIACTVAAGESWRDKPTKKGSVLYIAAEDSGGVRGRIRAYCVAHQLSDLDLDMRLVDGGINLMDPKIVPILIEEIGSMSDARLVLFDTLAASTPGIDENSSREMGLFLHNCRKIFESTGVSFVLIHHCGKDHSRGARGWSGIQGAADTVIQLQKKGEYLVATVEKQKNWICGDVYGFQLKPIQLCPSNLMDVSCTVQHVPNFLDEDLGEIQRRVLSVLQELAEEVEPVTEDALLTRLVSSDAAPPEGVRDRRREKYQRSIRTLIARHALINKDGFLILDTDSPF